MRGANKVLLAFKWPFDGVMKYFVFRVLPFGLTTAPYVFSKVMKQLVKFWRSHGYPILLYLDDGIGGDRSFERAEFLSREVRYGIFASGFTIKRKEVELGFFSVSNISGSRFRFLIWHDQYSREKN